MESDWNEFDRRDVGILTITTQAIEGHSRAKQFLASHPYRFPVLIDETRKVTKTYGVYHRLGIDAFRIARPAAFLLDRNAVIRWIAVAATQTRWPTTKQILEVIDAPVPDPD